MRRALGPYSWTNQSVVSSPETTRSTLVLLGGLVAFLDGLCLRGVDRFWRLSVLKLAGRERHRWRPRGVREAFACVRG